MISKLVPLGILLIAILALLIDKPLIMGDGSKGRLGLKNLNAQYKAYSKQIDEAQKKITALQDLQPQMANAQSQIQALKLAMPAAQQIPEVLVMTETIAKKAGLKITSIEVQPSSNTGNEVGVSLSGQGSYEGLFTFTEVLEKNVRPIQIRSLSIGRLDQGNAISATVSLGVIYQGTERQQVAVSN